MNEAEMRAALESQVIGDALKHLKEVYRRMERGLFNWKMTVVDVYTLMEGVSGEYFVTVSEYQGKFCGMATYGNLLIAMPTELAKYAHERSVASRN